MTAEGLPATALTPTTGMVRLRTLLSLLAGRGAYRFAYQAGNLVLLVVWGQARFSSYAAALGACMWLSYVGSSVEKAALKLLARVPRLTPELVRLSLAVVGLPLLACVAAAVPSALFAPGSRSTLYLLAAVWSTASGMLFVIAALNRLAARPYRDSLAFLTLAGCIAASVVATWAFTFEPVALLAFLDLAAVGLAVGLVATLPASWLRAGRGLSSHRRRVVRRGMLGTVVLLGAYDLASAVVVSALYALLSATGHTDQADVFYLVILVSGAAGSTLVYVLRVVQPHTAAGLRGAAGAAGGRGRARRLLILSVTGGCVSLAALAVPVLAAGQVSLAVLCAAATVEMVCYAVLTVATFLIENTDAAAPVLTAAAAVAGLLFAVGAGTALVGPYGTGGAVATLALTAVWQSAVLLTMLTYRYRS